jgi:hypothetical protein
MLSLSGNSETAFAALNSLNVNPLVYAEWNYNNIVKPYTIHSSNTSSLNAASGLNVAASWSRRNGGTVSLLSNGGEINEINTSGSCLKLSTNSKSDNDTFSSTVTLPSGSGYYKIIFYLKSYMKNVYGQNTPIRNVSIQNAGAGSFTGSVRYNIVPVNNNAKRPMLDYNNSISGSSTITSASGANISWSASAQNAVAFDIYRSKNNTSLMPYLTTIPAIVENISSGSYTYNDDFLQNPTTIKYNPTQNMKIFVNPTARVLNSSSPVENLQHYTRIISEQTGMIEKISNSIELDGSKYYRVEVFVGSTSTFTQIVLDISTQCPFINGSLLLCNAEMFKIDGWNFSTSDYYPIESVFDSYRPGEALLHPYLQTNDRYVDYGKDNQSLKPVSSIFFSNDEVFNGAYPYKQAHNSIFNRFKYYISPNDLDTSTVTVRAQYKNYLDINKIVIKTSNAIENMTTVSGSIQILGPNYSVLSTIALPAGTFDKSGIAVAYFDGISWSASSAEDGRGSWVPPTLTDSGIFQNVTSSVTGISYITNQPNSSSQRLSKNNPKPTTALDRVHVIEISPRLELDISGIVQDFSVNKMMDDSESEAAFPIGYMNGNQGSINISNIPVYKNNFPFTIFDNLSSAATISDIIRENVKFTVGLISPTNDFTDYVPFMTMYSDSWSIKDLDTITVDLYDPAKYLMSYDAPDYFCHSEEIFTTITNLFDICGFSDYDYNGLNQILKQKNIKINAFYCDRNQTIIEVLKSFFVAHQIAASFDEYGILRFKDLEDYLYQYTSNNFNPDFLVSDIPLVINKSSGSVYYEANLIKDSYSSNVEQKKGKITIKFTEPVRNFTNNADVTNSRRTLTLTNKVFKESNQSALVRSYLSKSIKGAENYFYVDPKLLTSQSHVGNLLTESGMAFLQGELISWAGLEYNFSGSSGTKPVQSINKLIYNSDECFTTSDEMISTHLSLTNVEWHPTGKIVGVQRGLKNTKPRNHMIFDDSTVKTNNAISSSNNFSSIIIYNNSNGSLSSGTPAAKASYGDSGVTFKDNIAKFMVHKPKTGKKHVLALIPKFNQSQGEYAAPVSASNFDFFQFVFTGPNLTNQKFAANGDESIVEIGFYIKHPTSPLLFGIRNVKNQSVLAVNEFSVSGVKPKTSSNQNHPSHSAPFQKLGKNVFDGLPHRIGLWINYENSTCYFYINQHQYGPYTIVGSRNGGIAKAKTNDWGVYVENLEKTFMNTQHDEKTLSLFVHEMYAYDYKSLGEMQYGHTNLYPPAITDYNFHWQSKNYLNEIIKNNPNCEPKYYFWGPLDLFGVKIYDNVAFDTTPVFQNTLKIEEIGYSGDWPGLNGVIKKTTNKDIAMSSIFSTPFRFSMMLVNNNKNNQFVWLCKTSKLEEEPSVNPFTLEANFMRQTDEITVEKIINPTNKDGGVILNTLWIQSKDEAEKLLSKSVHFANSFNTTVNLQIFGNPLIQVGDICKFVYTSKRIGYDPESLNPNPAYFLVKEVNQNFTGGLTTDLSLKPLFNTNSTSIA